MSKQRERIHIPQGFLRRHSYIRPRISNLSTSWSTPQVEIPDGATQVNGITQKMVEEAGILDLDAVKILVDAIEAAWDEGKVIVGHNISYDFNVLAAESRRATPEHPFQILGPVMDTMVLYRKLEARQGYPGRGGTILRGRSRILPRSGMGRQDVVCYTGKDDLPRRRGLRPECRGTLHRPGSSTLGTGEGS